MALKQKELSQMADVLRSQIESNRCNMNPELLGVWVSALEQTEKELLKIQKQSAEFHEGDYVLYIPKGAESDLSRKLYVLKEKTMRHNIPYWYISAGILWGLDTFTFDHTYLVAEEDLVKAEDCPLPGGFLWKDIGDFMWLESPDGIPWVAVKDHTLLIPEEGNVTDMDSFKKMAERNIGMLISTSHMLRFHAEMIADTFLLEVGRSWASGEGNGQCELNFCLPSKNRRDEMLGIWMTEKTGGYADIFIKRMDHRIDTIMECSSHVDFNKKTETRKTLIRDILAICEDCCELDMTRRMDITYHMKKLMILKMVLGRKYIWEMAWMEKDMETWKNAMRYLDEK